MLSLSNSCPAPSLNTIRLPTFSAGAAGRKLTYLKCFLQIGWAAECSLERADSQCKLNRGGQDRSSNTFHCKAFALHMTNLPAIIVFMSFLLITVTKEKLTEKSN